MKQGSLMPNPASALKCGRVAVLMGGESAEREVSLNSGNAVLAGLKKAGVDAFKCDLQSDVVRQLLELKADRVFNVLHGGYGENGSIQAVLDLLGLAYTGSGVAASALTMDKLATKRLLLGSDIPTPPSMQLNSEDDCKRLPQVLGLPVFVKPVLEGSSVGMTPVYQASDLVSAWQKAAEFGDVFAEKLIVGCEYTAAFIDQQVLPLIRLETPREFYDYEAKYIADDTVYTCPSGLNHEMVGKINRIVEHTIKVTGVRQWGRVDLMLDQADQPWVIEVNTVPGMTDHSLVPMAAAEAGLDMPNLVLRILESTLSAEGRDVG